MATQLATAITTGTITGRKVRQRPMRNTRMVSLRSSLPTGLLTLRHDVPETLTRPLAAGETPEEVQQQDTTPKVERTVQVRVETTARKGH